MSDAEKIFLKAFRGEIKGTLDRSVKRRILLGLNALVEEGLLVLQHQQPPKGTATKEGTTP